MIRECLVAYNNRRGKETLAQSSVWAKQVNCGLEAIADFQRNWLCN
jgi:hypothetical protein